MPIEIKELHIRVTVDAPPQHAPVAKPGAQRPIDENSDEKDAMIAECVEQVLQILHDKQER